MLKQTVAVLFGGVSSEHEVSLVSASSVIQNIPKEKYDIVCIGITKNGRWLLYQGDIEDIKTGEWEKNPDCVNVVISPDPSYGGILKLSKDGSFESIKIDCVFPVLHGKNGEDGTIQGLLELSQIPYVGCDTLSSAVCMDKDVTHKVLTSAGIPNAKWIPITVNDTTRLKEKCLDIVKKLGFPIFIKPANAGSSIGISKAEDMASLEDGIGLAFSHDQKVICEETIVGREIECAVLGNEYPRASVLGEIIPCKDFYDYEAKYQEDSTLIVPANTDEKISNEIRSLAIKAYTALGCSGLARVDFFLTKEGKIYLNEVNTLPGFTSISMYPRLWCESGTPYPELLDLLIKFAIEKHK